MGKYILTNGQADLVIQMIDKEILSLYPYGSEDKIRRLYQLKHLFALEDNESELAIRNVILNPSRRMVTVNKVEIILTFKEFELLFLLMDNPGIVMNRDKIMRHIWGTDFLGETRTVDMHIKTLRQKLGSAGYIVQTVRGVGYKVID